MNSNSPKKPVAVAIGAALATSLATASVAQAANPFSLTALTSAYMAAGEGNCGANKGKEGSCGGEKKEAAGDKSKAEGEMKCGEGKCGASHDKDKEKEKDKAKEAASGEEKKS